MPLYLVARVTVTDAAEYALYSQAVGPIFIREKVRVIASDLSPMTYSETEKRAVKDDSVSRIVMLEFRDTPHMERFFLQPDYIAAKVHRDAGARFEVNVFEGLPR